MSASFVAVRGTGGGTGFATSFPITGVTCTAGNDLVVIVNSQAAVSSISDGTNTYVADKTFPGTNITGGIWHFHYASGFSGTLTVNLSSAAVDYNGEAWECSGLNGANSSADVRDTANNAASFTNAPSAGTTATSASVGDLIVGAFGSLAGSAQTLTAGSGYTAVATVRNTHSELTAEYQTAASSAPANPTGTFSAFASYDAACVIYKASGGGGGPQAVTPASISATSTVTGTATKLAAVSPAAITASAAVSATGVAERAVAAAAVNATATVTGHVVIERSLNMAAITAGATVNAIVTVPGEVVIVGYDYTPVFVVTHH